MLNTERKDFEAQLAVLFGGFPQFLTEPRIEAYWRGLQKMPLSTFVRCVDHSLGEQGGDKLPTVNAVWQTSKVLRGQRQQLQKREEKNNCDDFTAFANRRLYEYLRLCGGVDEALLPKLVAEKNRLARQFLEVDSEERVDEKEFRTALQKGWNRIMAAA